MCNCWCSSNLRTRHCTDSGPHIIFALTNRAKIDGVGPWSLLAPHGRLAWRGPLLKTFFSNPSSTGFTPTTTTSNPRTPKACKNEDFGFRQIPLCTVRTGFLAGEVLYYRAPGIHQSCQCPTCDDSRTGPEWPHYVCSQRVQSACSFSAANILCDVLSSRRGLNDRMLPSTIGPVVRFGYAKSKTTLLRPPCHMHQGIAAGP